MTLAGTTLQRHTDTVDGFTRPACKVTPKLVTEGNAQLAIVRHNLGRPTLLAQTRTRGVDENAGLPDTRAQIPIAHLGALGHKHKTLRDANSGLDGGSAILRHFKLESATETGT